MDIQANFKSRIATNRFSEISRESAVVESDEGGPGLFEMAKKAVAVGMLALSVISPVNQSFAKDVSLVSTQAAENYFADVRTGLAERGSGVLGQEITQIAKSDRDVGSAYTWSITNNELGALGPTWFIGKKCTISYGDAGDMSNRYNYALNLPKDFDVGALEQMNAISACSVVGFMDETSFRQFKDTTTGYLPLVEVMTYAATAKYQPGQRNEMYDVMNGLAYSQFRSVGGDQQIAAIWKMAALQKIHAFGSTPDGAAAIQGAKPGQLLELVNIAARSAQAEIQVSKVADLVAGTEKTVLTTKEEQGAFNKATDTVEFLNNAGLTDAASAVQHAAKTGISKGDGYYSDVRESGCSDIHRFSQRRERSAQFWCRVWQSDEWKASGKTYMGDFANVARSILSQDDVNVALKSQ